ncbi:MAG: hypothetical protein ACR2GD_01325 [Pyrinomonadaceae bacterium]
MSIQKSGFCAAACSKKSDKFVSYRRASFSATGQVSLPRVSIFKSFKEDANKNNFSRISAFTSSVETQQSPIWLISNVSQTQIFALAFLLGDKERKGAIDNEKIC